MPLPRKATTGLFDTVDVNVWDIAKKKIIFTGGQLAAANFLGVHPYRVSDALSKKYKLLRKYAVRIKSTKQNDDA